MNTKKSVTFTIFALGLTLTLASFIGCGEDPNAYENETLVFENLSETDSVTAKNTDKRDDELTLKEQESSNFRTFHPLFRYGYTPYPLFDYYRQPLAVHVPVTPFASYVEYIHPFYVPHFLNSLVDDDDDGPFDY